MRFVFATGLGVILLLFPLVEVEAGEWITKRESSRISWSLLSGGVKDHFKLEKVFGPRSDYALFSSRVTGVRVFPRLQGIQFVQPNFRYHALDSWDPSFENSWGLQNSGQEIEGLSFGVAGKDVGAVKAWDIHTGSGEVVVAVIDSGIDLIHEELSSNLWVNSGETAANQLDDDGNGKVDDIFGWNFLDDSSKVQDDQYHGTFCAGVIGAEAKNSKGSRGVNWKVRLMAVKFLDVDGVGTTAGAIQSIEYAVKMGADVINASWGGTQYDQALFDTIKWATKEGVVFVAAAGNNGKNNDLDPNPIYPASFRVPGLISVSAYNNKDEIANFSNFGKSTVHIGAPGVMIFSTKVGGYRYGDGTSFASPFVAGGAALLKSFLADLNNKEIVERLTLTSEVISYYEKEKNSSGGRLQLYNALRDIRPPRPKPPENWFRFDDELECGHPYTSNQVERFEMKHQGATHIRAHFTKIGTESCCDRVVLKDKNERVVATYAGTLGEFWSADALGDTLYIELQSDYSISDFGFSLDAYEISHDSTLWTMLEGALGVQPILWEKSLEPLSLFHVLTLSFNVWCNDLGRCSFAAGRPVGPYPKQD